MDAKPPGHGTRRLRFDRFVVDMDRGCLLLGDGEVALRPKTFAVLQHLVENCGRLISKDELFAAVWPNVSVTDDTLVQSIGELRRALGDDGARLLKTVPRRGYRLEADVTADGKIIPSPNEAPAASSAARQAHASVGGWAMPFARSSVQRPLLYALGILVVIMLAAGLWFGSATGPKSASPSIIAGQVGSSRAEFAARPAIAVLPFLNQGDDAGRDYFADGLTQDIINVLGRFPELTVMSWNAVLPYKGKPESPGQVARNLAVDYQVEGSVVLSGERINVLVQFVSVDGRVL